MRLPQLKVECLSLALIAERLREDPDKWNTKSAIVLKWAPNTSGTPRPEGSESSLPPHVCILIVLDWDESVSLLVSRTREPRRGPGYDCTESSFER